MEISDKRTLRDLQVEFSKRFPFLSIEFYSEPHGFGEGSTEKNVLAKDKRIGEIRRMHNVGHLPLDDNMKVGMFEQLARDQFGIYLQVFRKSYGKWLQTWATDVWTLGEQNRRGEIMGNK